MRLLSEKKVFDILGDGFHNNNNSRINLLLLLLYYHRFRKTQRGRKIVSYSLLHDNFLFRSVSLLDGTISMLNVSSSLLCEAGNKRPFGRSDRLTYL